jgi:hypothetical protein
VFGAGLRLLRLRRSAELRGQAPASSPFADRRIRAVRFSPARSRAADLDLEDVEEDGVVLCGGAVGPGRYPSGGGERGLPSCLGDAFVDPWRVDEQR